MFQSFCWHGPLPGRNIPGIGSAMPERGKSGLAASRERTTIAGSNRAS
jgi:hypothetical protein